MIKLNMQINPNFILKTLYKTMTLTMPSMIYNPLSNTNLYIPIDIKPLVHILISN